MPRHHRAAVITGAGRGLGRALAEGLARRGTRVALVARNAREIEEAARGIRARGGTALPIAADVADPEAARIITALAHERLGPVDLVIHNASTLGHVPLPLVLDTSDEALARAFAVNVLGPARLTRALASSLVLGGAGTVVFVSSDAAVNAYPRWGAYGASKAAADHLARVLAAELADAGVDVVIVDPGEMNTRMHAEALPDADPATLAAPEAVAARLVALLEGDLVPTGSRVPIMEGAA